MLGTCQRPSEVKNLVNAWFFEIVDRRLDETPGLRRLGVAEALAEIGMIRRFTDGFAAMDEDDLAREIDKVVHHRLPSIAVVGRDPTDEMRR